MAVEADDTSDLPYSIFRFARGEWTSPRRQLLTACALVTKPNDSFDSIVPPVLCSDWART